MASSSSDAWNDFETLRQGIKHNTVDRLKQIVIGFNDECNGHISKSGKKQEIIDRIITVLDGWRATSCEDRWNKAKAIIYQVKNSGFYTPTRAPGASIHPLPPSFTAPPIKTSSYSNLGPGTMRYDPYAPPKSSASVPSSSLPKPNGQRATLRFKDSPFFQIDQAVSPIVECPESSSATDRRQQFVVFTLNNDHVAKFRSSDPKYQLRLFCTSSTFYSPNAALIPNKPQSPCLVEFPPTCEVRVNNVVLSANLKGLKKKPGTAPPPDLGKHIRLTSQNRVEMVYVNSQQPVPSKKFYLVVMLVESTTVETLVHRLKQSSYKSREEISQKMKSLVSQDDDIVAGPQKMSLKCPLSFTRIQTPCRSSKCVHPQCFDATSWYSMMEQTTTWLCPVCERILDCNDLIIDGYFDDILKSTPDSVEDVMVEAEGEWHTTDNKFGSSNWIASHSVPLAKAASVSLPKLLSTPRTPPPQYSQQSTSDGVERGKGLNVEIVVLDSDEEDEGRVKRELSPSFARGSSGSFENGTKSVPQSQIEDVIDLTLDSDEDTLLPPEPPTSKQAGKRKADDAGLTSNESLWKKGRIGEPATVVNGSADYPPMSHHVMVLPQPGRPTVASTQPQPSRYPPPYTSSNLQGPVYNNYQGRNSGISPLPPLQGNPYGHHNSHWA